MELDKNLKQFAKTNHVPISLDDTINLICNLINKMNYKKVLEIGTAIGYGAITMAENSNLNHIDTLEINELTYLEAKKNIKEKNLEEKINAINIDAKEFLKSAASTYDFIYLDGPKGQYINYLPHLLEILNAGGMIVADNIFFHGMVTGKTQIPVSCRAMIKGLHKFIHEITMNPSLNSQILNIGDGVAIISKK